MQPDNVWRRRIRSHYWRSERYYRPARSRCVGGYLVPLSLGLSLALAHNWHPRVFSLRRVPRRASWSLTHRSTIASNLSMCPPTSGPGRCPASCPLGCPGEVCPACKPLSAAHPIVTARTSALPGGGRHAGSGSVQPAIPNDRDGTAQRRPARDAHCLGGTRPRRGPRLGEMPRNGCPYVERPLTVETPECRREHLRPPTR